MNIEALKAIHPTIDWDKKCQDYKRCADCPIGKMRIESTVNWGYCKLLSENDSDESLSFKDVYEDAIREIQRYRGTTHEY